MLVANALLSLKQNFLTKFSLSIFGWGTINFLGVFKTDLDLLFFLMILVLVDFITGNIKAMQKDGFFKTKGFLEKIKRIYKYFFTNEVIKSSRWGDTVGKFFIYGVVVFLFAGLGNILSSHGDSVIGNFLTIFNDIELIPVLFISFNELKSIGENLNEAKLFEQIFKKFKEIVK